ncbi:MAG TPA: GNAT family N-acetyltransferase [Anaerolineales bacterium]
MAPKSLDRFSTARLLAERLTALHLPNLRQMDQNELFMAHLGGVRDEAGTRAYFNMNVAHWEEHGFGLWMLRDGQDGTVIGRAVLRHLDVDGADEVEVGYGFLPEFWGQGLATEVARACVGIGLERVALSSVVAITLPTNVASRRVMEKARLTYERKISHQGIPHLLFRVGQDRPTS